MSTDRPLARSLAHSAPGLGFTRRVQRYDLVSPSFIGKPLVLFPKGTHTPRRFVRGRVYSSNGFGNYY